jgi:hypothetical protein
MRVIKSVEISFELHRILMVAGAVLLETLKILFEFGLIKPFILLYHA